MTRKLVVAGAGVWVVLVATLPERGMMGEIDRLLLLGMLVTTPLAFALATDGTDEKAAWPLQISLFPTALLGAASFFLRSGIPAALMTMGWLATCAGIALSALIAARRMLTARRPFPLPDVCLLAARLYLPIGAGWLSIARLGRNPMGFSDAIVLLTAVHFHFAGFAAPVLVGLAARNLYVPAVRVRRPLLSAACLGVVLGTPLLAAGITFSRALESFAALLLAVSVGTLGALQIGLVRALFESRVARMGMALSGASVLVGMLLAAAYALRGLIPIPLDIPLMARTHGWLNGIGFALLGLTSWSVERSSCSSR